MIKQDEEKDEKPASGELDREEAPALAPTDKATRETTSSSETGAPPQAGGKADVDVIKETFGAEAALEFVTGKKTYDQIVLTAYEAAKKEVKTLEAELQRARETLDELAKSGLPPDERVSEGHAKESDGSGTLGFSDDFLKAANKLFTGRA